MKSVAVALFWGVFALLTPACGQQTDLSSDLKLLSRLFTGEFNNYQQVHQEREDSVAADMAHEHIHSIFHPVQLPWLGHTVYFVKQYMDNDPAKVYRQRIYNFHVNESERAIQLDIYAFQDTEQEQLYANAHLHDSLLAGLTREQLANSPGCEVFWSRVGDEEAFVGYMKHKACNFLSRRSGKRIFITDSLLLNRDEIRIRDEAEDEEGNYVFGHKGKVPHILRRCSHYTGWAAAQPPGADEMTAIRGLRLHNQGDRQPILFADGLPTGFELRLAELVYGHKLSVLQLAVFKTGEARPVTYTWADPGSRRIGINMLRLFQAGLTLE